jgi:hypothetical protein
MTGSLAAGLFHTGITVDDLGEAMREMTERLGLAWAEPVRRTGAVHTPSGPIGRDMIITYSRGGPHHIELVQYIDDTAYRHLAGGPPRHHIGFWAGDFLADIARLEGLGYRCECSGVGSDGGRCEFAYHHDPRSDTWIELVDARRRPAFEAWTALRS